MVHTWQLFRYPAFFVILRSEATKNPVNFVKKPYGILRFAQNDKPFMSYNSLLEKSSE